MKNHWCGVIEHDYWPAWNEKCSDEHWNSYLDDIGIWMPKRRREIARLLSTNFLWWQLNAGRLGFSRYEIDAIKELMLRVIPSFYLQSNIPGAFQIPNLQLMGLKTAFYPEKVTDPEYVSHMATILCDALESKRATSFGSMAAYRSLFDHKIHFEIHYGI